MKNINPAITSAELNAVQLPRHQIIIEDSLIRYSNRASLSSDGGLNTQIAPVIETLSSASDHAWAVFNSSGTTRVKYVRIGTSSDWQLASANSTQIAGSQFCQRPGLFNDGSNVYLYYPNVNTGAGNFQLQRVTLTSQTVNPVSLASAAAFGPVVPFAYEFIDNNQDETLEHFNTIRAVLPVQSGVIVITGDHRYSKRKIFLSFYYITASGYRKLSTSVTGDIDTSISLTNDSPMYSQACAYEENGTIYVFFNTNQNERAAYFTIRNGVESEIEPVIPIDREDSTHNFYCSAITKINNLYVLCGRATFKNSDDSQLGFDLYLTSQDLKNWSLGETNSFLSLQESRGRIVYSNNYLYYLGNLYWARAVPNKEFAPSATTLALHDITSRVAQWTLSQSLNEADSFSMSLNNADLFFNSGTPSTANFVYLSAGQDQTKSQIGVFYLDSKDQGYTTDGVQLREANGRDIAMKKLNDWQSPIDMWLAGAYQFQSDMKTKEGIIVKSKDIDEFGTFTEGSNFKFTGLNTPYMMLFDAPYSESSIIKTSVYMQDQEDGFHISQLGFILGAHEDIDGNFNSLMLLATRERGGNVPYGSTDRIPVLAKLNLVPVDTSDPDKVDTGLNYEKFISSLWREAADENAIAIAAGATYEHVSNFRIPKQVKTDLMVRLNGREIFLYSKPRVRTTVGWAQNAEWDLKTVVTVNDSEILYPDKNGYGGIVVSTDVAASKNWFAQGKYGDMVVQLSYATDYMFDAQGPWTRHFVTGNRAGNQTDSYIIEGLSSVSWFRVGMRVMIHGVSYLTGFYPATILEIWDTRIRIDFNMPPAYVQSQTGSVWVPDQGSAGSTPDYYYNIPGGVPSQTGSWNPTYSYQTIYNYQVAIYGLSNNDYFGEVSSQSRPAAINNSSSYVNIETGATKKANLLEGRGALVTSDSTAMSIRHFDSDGIFHRLKSGDTGTGGSYVGFDATSPLINTNKWKFVMYHGKFFDGAPSSVGCKDNGYFIVDEEVIRYIQYASLKRGIYPGDPVAYNTATICPTAYMPIKDASLGTSRIYNWKSYGGALPGDQFDNLQTIFGISPVGMLVEFLSKNVSKDNTEDGNGNYYISAVINNTPSQTAAIDLSTPLRTRLVGPIFEIDNPSNPYWSVPENRNQAPEGDMAAVSGRAQFNTKKTSHSEDAVVRYYPCNAQGQPPYIQLYSTEYYNGSAVTTEDTVRRIASMAGVRNIKTRTGFDSPSASSPLTYTLTSSPLSLPLQENMEDFTLEGEFYVPGNDISGGAVVNRNELRVYFRNKYYLAIEQYVTNSDIVAGYQGNLSIRLVTTSTLINEHNSERTLEAIRVRNRDSFAGSYSGSSGSYTLSPNLSSKVNIKISVNRKFISVEVNNKKMMSFCIEEYQLDGGDSLAFYETGPIALSYKSNIAGNSNSVRVYGAGDPMSGYAIRKDATAKSAIGEILEARHIFMRSTEEGGIEIGQFWNRDYFGNLHTFIVSDQEQQATEQTVGHIAYKSDKIITNWIDEDWVIQNGYKYLSGSGAAVENSYFALREAKLILRKQKEESLTRNIEALARLALQPEDEVDISHPNLPSGTYIINSIDLTAQDSSSLTASYSVRKKV